MTLKKNLELLSTSWMVVFIIVGPMLYTCLWFFPITRLFALLYTVFIIFDTAHERGGRTIPWIRDNFPLFKYLGNYFEADLHREVALSPENKYIFGYHPHGIISFGLQCGFGPATNHFKKVFPGINMTLLTLNVNFYIPFYRDFFMAIGACSVSKRSIEYLLSQGKGRAVAIVVGGGNESLYAQPDLSKLVLKNRKGFVKLAFQTGAHLVPVFCFGENNLYNLNQSQGLVVSTIEKILKLTGIYFPKFVGRGFSKQSTGILPKKIKLHSVVGAPIEVTLNSNPTQDEIDKLHKTYMNRLKELYDKHKHKYHPTPNPPELEFV